MTEMAKKNSGRFAIMAMAGIAALIINFTAMYIMAMGHGRTGWQKTDEGVQYLYDEEKYAVGLKKINGKRYYFDKKGYLRYGWIKLKDATYYANKRNGELFTGFRKIGDETYYFSGKGKLRKGWIKLKDGKFYADAKGVIKRGPIEADGGLYLLDEDDGHLLTGWLDIDRARYYAGKDGKLAIGLSEIDGKLYFFSEKGKMQTGWQKPEGGGHILVCK